MSTVTVPIRPIVGIGIHKVFTAGIVHARVEFFVGTVDSGINDIGVAAIAFVNGRAQ